MAERLLAPRDLDPAADDTPSDQAPMDEDASPAEVQFVRRVRADRTRARTRRRAVAAVILAVLVIGVALAWHVPRRADSPSPQVAPAAPASQPGVPKAQARRSEPAARVAPDEPAPAPRAARDEPARAPHPSPPRPATDDVAALPPRAERGTASDRRTAEVTQPRLVAPQELWREPTAALPRAVARPAPDVRASVTQNPNVAPGAIDYTVRLTGPRGEPVRDADVRLRGVTADGVLVEAQLDPSEAPGVFRGLIAVSSRGPRDLTLRISRAEGVVELPVAPAPPRVP